MPLVQFRPSLSGQMSGPMCGFVRSSQDYPQFKDSTVYRQVRPTKLDKIKNLHLEVQVSSLTLALG